MGPPVSDRDSSPEPVVEARQTGTARWDRYTAAATRGPAPPAAGPKAPAGSSRRGTARPKTAGRRTVPGAAAGLLQRIRDLAPEAPPELQLSPLLELRLVPVAAAAWVAAALAVRSAGGADATTAGIAVGGTALFLLVLAALPARLKRAQRSRKIRPSLPPMTPEPRKTPGLLSTLARACAAPLAAAALVSLCAGVLLAERTAGPVGAAISRGATITGELRAVTDARAAAADRFSGRSRYLVEAVLEEATSGGQRFDAAATVLVLGGSGYEDVQLGDTFSAAGTLEATDPGERSVAVLYASGEPDIVSAGGWLGQTARIRTAFAAAAQQHAGAYGDDAAGLLPGMALGDRSTLDASLETAMKNTGLTHLVAVSGANCGYLLAFVFLLARTAHLPRGAAAAAGILALVGFVLVVRPDASVLRAAVMGSLGTLAVLSGRGKLPAALLCLSITVLLAVDPWLSGSYAFILSVLATAGLILLGPRLTKVLSRYLPWPLAAALAVPLAAQFFCSPVLVLLQPQVPVFSLAANVAVAPVVPLVTVAGMAAALLTATVPLPGIPFLLAAGAGAAWTAAVARFFEGLPGSLVPWPGGAPGALLMAAAAAAGVWLLWRAESGRRETRTDGSTGPAQRAGRNVRSRRRTAAAAFVLLLLPPGTMVVRERLQPGPLPESWTAAACDVGQGDGLVVRTGPGRAMVVDAGPDPDAMDRCLTRLGIETVDLFILSHAHLDHYGGAAGVLQGRRVSRIAYSTAEPELAGPLQKIFTDSGAELVRLTAGMTGTAGDAGWEVLWPPADSVQATENDASAVVLVTASRGSGSEPEPEAGPDPETPPLSLLLTGDIEDAAAARLLARNPWLAAGGVDVLKVPHHGARNGGTALIEDLRPSLALISVGADNDYGHPAPSILSSLQDTGTAIARTDLLGSVSLTVEGTTLKLSRLDG